MWVIQDGVVLLQLPDDAPIPPGSVRAELPAGFLGDPGAYRVRDGRIERRSDDELRRRQASRARRVASRLTPDEVRRVRRALGTGEL